MADDDTSDTQSVVIATDNCEKALYIIARDAMKFNELELHFTERYAPTVEYLLRILRKGFGWREVDRGTKEVANTRCRYNESGFCVCSKVVTSPELRMTVKCSENVRSSCKHYDIRFSNRITVNYVSIEKVGQAKEL